MTVELAELIPSLRASLNVPGATRPLFNFDNEDPWVEALAAGFWNSKSRGFYANYRVNLDGDAIVNPDDSSDDLPREDQTILVLQTAINSVRALELSMFTTTRDKAGPVETERQRSSTLLRALLDDLRKELEDIKDEMLGSGNTTIARVIDGVLAREGYVVPSSGVFVN